MARYARTVAISIALSALLSTAGNSSSEHRSGTVAPHIEHGLKNEKTRREFEAVILKSLLDPVLTTGRNGAMGPGKAGRYWQSLMSEHLTKHIADSRQLRLLNPRPNTPRAQQSLPMAATGVLASCTSRDCARGGAWHTLVFRDPAAAAPSLIERSWSAAIEASTR